MRRLLLLARNTVVSALRIARDRDKQSEDFSVADIYSAPPDAAGSLQRAIRSAVFEYATDAYLEL